MTAPNDTPPRKRSGRGFRIVLALSLGLNLLILGAIGGAFLGGHRDGPVAGRSVQVRALGLGPLGAALDRGDRAAVVAAASMDRDHMRAQRAALVQATRDFAEIVRSDPFDRSVAETLLEDQRAIIHGLQGRGQAALLDHLGTMPVDARARFADNLLEVVDRRRNRR